MRLVQEIVKNCSNARERSSDKPEQFGRLAALEEAPQVAYKKVDLSTLPPSVAKPESPINMFIDNMAMK